MGEPVVNIDDDAIDVDTEALTPAAWSTRDVDPMKELARFEAAAELQRRLIPASIKCTKPQDWVDMGGKAYLQATGVERIAPLWGLVFGQPEVEKIDQGGGEYYFVARGFAASRRTGCFYKSVEGGRSSDDPFFVRFDEDKPELETWKGMSADDKRDWKRTHRIPPDELDVRKAAITNWQCRAASMLTGLRGLTPADLAAAGLAGVKKVDFAGGTKGGATSADLGQAKAEFWNDILKRTGGDLEASRKLIKECTSFKKDDGTMFDGYSSHDGIKSAGMLGNAKKKLAAHPVFGDAKMAAGEGKAGA
jgi:hypothetical protein